MWFIPLGLWRPHVNICLFVINSGFLWIPGTGNLWIYFCELQALFGPPVFQCMSPLEAVGNFESSTCHLRLGVTLGWVLVLCQILPCYNFWSTLAFLTQSHISRGYLVKPSPPRFLNRKTNPRPLLPWLIVRVQSLINGDRHRWGRQKWFPHAPYLP